MIKSDFIRAYSLASGSTARKVFECLRSPGVHAVVIHRISQWLQKQSFLIKVVLKPFVIIERYFLHSRWGIDISPDAIIGCGFHINHYGGIFIGGGVVIGEYLTITHDITIGYSRSKNHQGCPTIGNNVYIAPGAKLAGKIKIGNNVNIGANAVVERDIPNNAVVQIQSPLVVTFPNNFGKSSNCDVSEIA